MQKRNYFVIKIPLPYIYNNIPWWTIQLKIFLFYYSCKNYFKNNFAKMLDFLFNFISFSVMTWFMFSVLRISIQIPQLFKESSALKFDSGRGLEGYVEKYSNSTDRQVALLFSDFGFLHISMISIPLFLLLGIFLFSFTSKEKQWMKDIWFKVLGNSAVIAGLLVTICSVWRS